MPQIHTFRLIIIKQLINSILTSLSSPTHTARAEPSTMRVKMRLIVGLIVGISVLMGTGQALRCIQCSSYTDTNCYGAIIECPASLSACGSTLIRNRGFRWTSYFQMKSCVDLSECFNNGRVTGLYAETSFATSCCFNDSCNNVLPTLPIVNLTLNNLFCPAYVDTTMEPCDIKNISVCTGDQNRCVRYSATTTLEHLHPYVVEVLQHTLFTLVGVPRRGQDLELDYSFVA
ncbi:PREDICTED: phospholipase A2 inhibitor and Ly6/PLAUR domain-containing protein-like [Nanorana parkeri]|uniref:phospholipase A2 inhibitor and Ly6/PLAUR domain-containing protein-like n=1 Tax=Nanorana parkeri TaxID=125878 RepID=UPI000853F987|nr:PREDICTED: phospholipase A2 inhibitor and Ly6/PLAUR domain-containing protein-like [Nanorana parkeri]